MLCDGGAIDVVWLQHMLLRVAVTELLDEARGGIPCDQRRGHYRPFSITSFSLSLHPESSTHASTQTSRRQSGDQPKLFLLESKRFRRYLPTTRGPLGGCAPSQIRGY